MSRGRKKRRKSGSGGDRSARSSQSSSTHSTVQGAAGASRAYRLPLADHGPLPTRCAQKLYNVTEQHILLFIELHQLFPDRPPVVSINDLKPGLESIETLSQKIFHAFARDPDQSVFMALCQLNKERITDYVDARLDQTAWPLDGEEVYLEACARVFQEHVRRALGNPLRGNRRAVRDPAGSYTVYDMFVDEVDHVINEWILEIRGFTVPLPGLKVPPLRPAERVLKDSQSHLFEKGCQISEKDLRHWVAFVLMGLKDEGRRMIHLRFQRDLSLEEIAERLEITPLEAGQRLRQAELDLMEGLDRLLVAFKFVPEGEEGDQGASEPPASVGKRSTESSEDETENADEGRIISLRDGGDSLFGRRRPAPKKKSEKDDEVEEGSDDDR